MNADKIKQIVAGVLTLIAVSIPHSSGFINAAGGQAEIIAAVVAVYTVVHGIVDYAHTKVTGKLNGPHQEGKGLSHPGRGPAYRRGVHPRCS